MIAPLLALALAALPSPADTVARVNSTVVTAADVQERQRMLAGRGRPPTPAQVVSALVDEVLLAGEARRQGLDREPGVVEQLAAQRRPLLVEALVADAAAKTQPPEELLKQLYHSSGDTVRLTLAKFTSEADAKAAADRVRAGAALGEEAKRSVDAALARASGDTGSLSRGQLEPALAEVAFRAKLGELFGPVELKLGWAIGRVEERAISDEAGYPARREALVAFARKQLAAQTRQHLTAQLKAKHGAKVDEPFLRSLGNRTDATPAELDRVIATVNGKPLRYRTIHATISSLAGSGGHLAGPATKVALAQRAVEEHLLADAALERGLDQAPEVARVLPGIEWNILASAYVARVAKAPAAGTADPKVRARLDELRARAKIKIDEARLAALASPPPAQHPAPRR